jgi:signal transduction histidine kinase
MNLADDLPLFILTRCRYSSVGQLDDECRGIQMHDESAGGSSVQTAASDQGVIKVAVRDFGPGIEEQALQVIFEPFFTTKRSGLGMGLSLSRSIIESHGGHIWAQNNPDRGSTFYFDLPEMPNFHQNHQPKMSLVTNEL